MENMSINIVTIICSAGEKLAKLSFLKPKPPVPAVENAVFSASNTLIPPMSRAINSAKVSTKYME